MTGKYASVSDVSFLFIVAGIVLIYLFVVALFIVSNHTRLTTLETALAEEYTFEAGECVEWSYGVVAKKNGQVKPCEFSGGTFICNDDFGSGTIYSDGEYCTFYCHTIQIPTGEETCKTVEVETGNLCLRVTDLHIGEVLSDGFCYWDYGEVFDNALYEVKRALQFGFKPTYDYYTEKRNETTCSHTYETITTTCATSEQITRMGGRVI